MGSFVFNFLLLNNDLFAIKQTKIVEVVLTLNVNLISCQVMSPYVAEVRLDDRTQ